MYKLAALLLLFAVEGARAGEVGTDHPQVATAANSSLALASVEKGADENWTSIPFNYFSTLRQKTEYKQRLEAMDDEISASLDDLVAQKAKENLAF